MLLTITRPKRRTCIRRVIRRLSSLFLLYLPVIKNCFAVKVMYIKALPLITFLKSISFHLHHPDSAVHFLNELIRIQLAVVV